MKLTFLQNKKFALPAVSLSSRSRLRGTQVGRLYTAPQVWVPAGPRGACSGRSKLRNLAGNRGIAFRPDRRANQAHANPKHVFFLFFFSSLPAAVLEVPQ